MSMASHTTKDHACYRRVLQARYYIRLVLLVFGLFWSVNVPPMFAQTYLQNLGVPAFTTALPVENGFINAANGNLHIEIPLGTFPQRAGGQDKVVLMYDSAFWTPYYSWYTGSIWEPINVYTGGPPGAAGWRLVTSGDQGATQYGEYEFGYCSADDDYAEATYSPWIWIAPDGTQHSFPASTTQALYPTDCPASGVSSSTAYASDGSGFYISINGYTNATVYAPDGTAIGPLTWTSGGYLQTKADPNGNQYTTTLTYSPYEYKYSDTLNRTVVDVTASSDLSTYYYTVPNTQSGGTSTYTLKTTSSSIHTAFGYTGWSENTNPLPEVTEIDLPDGTKYQFTYDTGTGSGNYGLMKQMTLPTGSTITYGYSNFTDGAANVARWITQRTTPDSSTPWTYTPSVLSSCTYPYVLNCQQQVEVQKPSGDYAQYTFTLNGGAWPTLVQYYDASSTLLATTLDCYNFVSVSSGTCTYSPATGAAATNIYKTSTKTTLPVPSGNVSRVTEYTWDTGNIGNLLKSEEWNFGSDLSGAADRTTETGYYSSGHVINRPTTITVKDKSLTPVGATVNCYDYTGGCGGSSFASVSAVNHDSSYGTSYTARGDLTQVQRYTDSSHYVTSSMTYDITGQMLTSKDPNSNEPTYSYTDNFFDDTGTGTSNHSVSTPTNAYLYQATYPIIGAVTFGHYWGTGQTAYVKDVNSQTTSFHFYDSLNRPTSTIFPDTGWSDAAYPSGSETQVDLTTGITSTSPASCTGNACRLDRTLLDGLGRLSSQILVSDPEGEDSAGTTYDLNGRISTVSNPHRSTSYSTDGSQTIAYDGLDRTKQVTEQDGSAVHTYYGAGVTSTVGGATSQLCSSSTYGVGYPILKVDEASKKLQSWIDGFGRTIEVDEPDPSGSLTVGTCYKFDLNNNVTNVLQSGDRARTFVYDFLSRLTSASNPESGTTTYAYDGNGNVTSKTDARSITTTYNYDALNRLTEKSYSDGTPTAYYLYDQSSVDGLYPTNPIGRLTFAATNNGTNWLAKSVFSYDSMGRVLDNFRCTPSTCASGYLAQYYTYDLSSNVTSFTNGFAQTTTQLYDSADRIYQVTSSWIDSTHPGSLAEVDHWYTNGFFPTGAARQMLLWNGLEETNIYNSRLQPCRINVNSSSSILSACGDATPSSNVLDLSVGYNAGSTDNGNVVSFAATGAQSFSRTYTYDQVNRISTMSASGDTCSGLSWVYDVWGNRKEQTATGGTCGQWSASYDSSNHITIAGSTTYGYDAAGNLTYDGAHHYHYDAENRLIQVDGTLGTCSTATACYVYDAMGHRVEKIAGSYGADYVYNLDGQVDSVMEGSGRPMTRAYVYLNGKILAEYTSSNTYFVHQDHLGSTRMVSEFPTPSIAECDDYYPFGESISCGGSTMIPQKFTGQERDSESDLDNFIARYMSSTQGRFMSPDPLLGDIGDPQSLNRYAYVRNNPLTLTDPTGMDACGGETENAACGGGCDFCFDFSYIWNPPPPPPPVYNPPNPSGDPNPQAGNPDPSGPFSGPVWQEINLPMQPFNLAGLLGIQMPDLLISDATDAAQTQAPNKRPPWYENSCITGAIGSGALHLGIDSIGLIPEAGGLARVIGHQAGYVGVVADQTGSNIIKAVGGSTSTGSFFTGLGDTSPEGVLSTGLTVAGFIPGLGQVSAIGSILLDTYKTAKAIGQCH